MRDIEQDCNQTTTEAGNLEAAKSIALEMLEQGVCCGVIAKRTGLAKEEIKKLNNHVCDH